MGAIVNPANQRLDHGGGAAHTIARAAGADLYKACQQYIEENEKLKTGSVWPSTAGNLKSIQYVIHAVGPDGRDIRDTETCFRLVKLTFFNCLLCANDLKVKSIAIPAISSGIFLLILAH